MYTKMYTCLVQDGFSPSPSSVLGIQAVIQKHVQLPYTVFSTLVAMYRSLIRQTTKVSTTCTAEHPEDSRSAQEPVGTEHNSPSAKSTVDTDSDDVASYIGRSVSDADKYWLLKHHFQPDVEDKFPKASNWRSFQHKWLRDNKP